MVRVTRRLSAGATLAVAVGVFAGSIGLAAGASTPDRVTTSIDFSVVDPYYSAVCGTPVLFFNQGTMSSTLFRDEAGAVTREIDTNRHDTVGWEAPATGGRIQFPNSATLITIYPDGTGPGSPAVVTGSGLNDKIPGVPAEAGLAVFSAHIDHLDADGVPIVAFDALLRTEGHADDPAAFDAATCAALGA